MLDFFQGLEGTVYWVVVLPALFLGLTLLTFGGDWLADGASSLAANFRIEPVVIGITVVSIATSAPELFTCLIAGFRDQGDNLVLGNIAGSNLANVALILGVAGLISPIIGRPRYYFWEIPWLLLATIIFVLFCYGGITQFEGVALVLLMISYLIVTLRLRPFFLSVLGPIYKKLGFIRDLAQVNIGNFDELEEIEKRASSTAFFLVIGGTLFLLVGASLLVDSAQAIAIRLHINQGFIGLTVVAIGTSLPELAASVAAARKKQTGLIAGNIFGSNLFNMLFVGGVTATASPIEWDGSLKKELFLMLAVTAFLTLVFRKKSSGHRQMGRAMGFIFITLYMSILIYSAISLAPVVK
ncbi:MAG: calcium/sodium antiporter [Opitutae bacterium]|nr:calcium/sodium antiporter [Opitutae bacterium]